MQIHAQKKKTGLVSPRKFVQRVKAENELFSSYMHQVRLGWAAQASVFSACWPQEATRLAGEWSWVVKVGTGLEAEIRGAWCVPGCVQ